MKCWWTVPNNSWSKSARSLKYSPHWGALQDFEWTNAKIFTTQQLSKLLLISKRSPKELDTIEMNNILKFQHNSWTINRDHIKFKFSFKLGWGFLWLMLESWSITPTEAHGKKAPTNKCKKNYYTSIKQTFVDFKKVSKGMGYYWNQQHIKISAKFVDNQ